MEQNEVNEVKTVQEQKTQVPAEKKDAGNLHIVSFVTGLIGCLTGSSTVLLGIVLGIMSIVCAVKQKKRTDRYEGMSVAGMILGIIGLVGAIGSLIAWLVVALIYGGAFGLGIFGMILSLLTETA